MDGHCLAADHRRGRIEDDLLQVEFGQPFRLPRSDPDKPIARPKKISKITIPAILPICLSSFLFMLLTPPT